MRALDVVENVQDESLEAKTWSVIHLGSPHFLKVIIFRGKIWPHKVIGPTLYRVHSEVGSAYTCQYPTYVNTLHMSIRPVGPEGDQSFYSTWLV